MWWCLAPERLVAAGLPRSLSHNSGPGGVCARREARAGGAARAAVGASAVLCREGEPSAPLTASVWRESRREGLCGVGSWRACLGGYRGGTEGVAGRRAIGTVASARHRAGMSDVAA